MTPEQKEAAWNAYQTFPIDMCADHDDEYRKAVIAAVEAALAASQPSPAGCTMGVGCDETGVCYAEANGQPDRCEKPADDTGQAVALRRLLDACLLEFGWNPDANPDDPCGDDKDCQIQWGDLFAANDALAAPHPAPLDAERVREAWAYRVHDFHVARSPVKARARALEGTEHLYPASRKDDAYSMAKVCGGTCTPLYPAEDAQ